MKLKVLKPFINKENKEQVFEAGEVIEINDAVRINDIVKRGLGEVIVEQPTGADNETPAPATVADEKTEEKKEDEKPKAGRSSRKPKKADKDVEEQPEEGDADPAPEDGAESEGTETKEE